MARYAEEKTLKALADQLIEKHHQNLRMLKIAYLFKEEATVTDGKVVAGMARKVDDPNWTIHKKDVIIEIARDVWSDAEPRFQAALMDHELSHILIVMDENGTPKMDEITNRIAIRIKHHDIEEFVGVLERHGAYHKNLREFLLAFAKNKEEKKKARAAGMTTGFKTENNSEG